MSVKSGVLSLPTSSFLSLMEVDEKERRIVRGMRWRVDNSEGRHAASIFVVEVVVVFFDSEGCADFGRGLDSLFCKIFFAGSDFFLK